MVVASLFLLISSAWAGAMGPWLDEEPAQEWLSPFDAPAPQADRSAPMCTPGTLKNGVLLPDLRDLVQRYDASRSYGTQTLVDVIVESAQQVAWLLPDADPLFVGDMSRKYGGRLGGHRQHQDGLDADIGLYTLGHHQPLTTGFQDVSPSRLDVEATWTLFRAMLDTGLVDYILLDPLLVERLKKHVVTVEKLPPAEVAKLFPPQGTWPREPGFIRGAPNHRNHFHLRLRCGSSGDVPPLLAAPEEDDIGLDTADPFSD